MPSYFHVPYRHPKTGVFWIKGTVPSAVRDAPGYGGPKQYNRSLKTRDPKEAETAAAKVRLDLDAEWKAALAASPPPPSPAIANSVSLSDARIEALAARWSERREWEEEGYREPAESHARALEMFSAAGMGEDAQGIVEALIDKAAAELLAEDGGDWAACDGRSRVRLRNALRAAHKAVYRAMLARAQGNHLAAVKGPPRAPLKTNGASGISSAGAYPVPAAPSADRSAPTPASGLPALAGPSVPLMNLFEAYAKASALAPSTVQQFRSIVGKFVEWLKRKRRSTDAREVTRKDVQEWLDELRETQKLSAKRLKEGYLAGVRATFGWAVKKGRLDANPARDVYVEADKRKAAGRLRRDLSLDEAATILRASLAVDLVRDGVNASTWRWVPWLLAYSGARVAEITQLRKCDVLREKGEDGQTYDAIRITPEAGSTKTGGERLVPLHPHLIEQGFLKFVAARPEGPLFFGEGEGREMPATRAKRLAVWVRELGVTDVPQPNHGWRHRFKSEARRLNMPADVRDYLQGHAPRSEGEAYGHMPIELLVEWVAKLPRYEADG
ncbi:DUF6538 domain-containing protein [Methylocella sp.]|uniref:DUF6538 domain-containing protein n=1 Tax=Methylocella sp. TaxID=1978226 RepID=UPI0035B3E15B